MKSAIDKTLFRFGIEHSQLFGLLDFAIGLLALCNTWHFAVAGNYAAFVLMTLFGTAVILYSMFTDYRKSVLLFLFRKLQKAFDITLGVTRMALFPAKFHYSALVFIITGILTLIGIVLI